MVAYLVLVETAGFIATAATLTVLLMWRLGNRSLVHWVTALAFTAIVVPVTYFVFAVALRVPLPQRWLELWLGW